MTFQAGNKPAYNDAVLFGIVLVGLLVTRRGTGTGRVDADASATWQATREIRPVPREMRRLPEVVWGRAGLWAIVGVFVLTLPLWLSTSRLNLATIIVIFGIVAASLVVLTGWAGQVSLGQMAFVGVGAAVGGALTDHRQLGPGPGDAGRRAGRRRGRRDRRLPGPAPPRPHAGGVAPWRSACSSRRTCSTAPIPFLARPRCRAGASTGGRCSASSCRSETAMFYACLAVLALALIMVVGLRRSRTGRVLIAIRENEKAARAYGVNATRTSLAAFALSGFLAAVAGALYVHQQTGLSAEPYLPQRQPRAVHDGGDRRPRLAAGRAARRHLRPLGRLLPAGRVAVPGHRRRPAARAARVPERVRRRAGRPARRRAAARSPPRRGIVVPSLLADVRVEEVADAPPEETVLAEAAEIAELAEADDPGTGDGATPVPVAAVDRSPPGDGATVPNGAHGATTDAGSGTGDDTVEEVRQ